MPRVPVPGPLLLLLIYFLAYIVYICPLSPPFLVDLLGPTVRFLPITVTTCVFLLFAVLAIKVHTMKDLYLDRNKEAALQEASRLRDFAVTMREDASKMEAEADKLESIHLGNSQRDSQSKNESRSATQEAVTKAKHRDASVVDDYSDFSDDAPIPTPASSKHNRSASNKSHEPATPGVFNRKIYCSHWLRTGECDFTQQGCEFLHVIPDPETLKRMGYRTYPRWYCEKMNIPVGTAPLGGDSVPKSSSVSPPRVPASLYKKIYCSHWLRTGECDYLQQGCIYLHLIPELKILNEMGLRTYPRWWRDKISMDDGATAPMGGRRLRRVSPAADHSHGQGPSLTERLFDVEVGDVAFDDAHLDDASFEDAKAQVL